MAEIGTGITIAFQSGFFAEILDVKGPSAAREAIQTSHMGTTNAHTFVPADLVDWGELVVELAFDPAKDPNTAMTAAAESITMTFPDSGAAKWVFSGFMTGYEPSIPFEDRCTCTATIKVSGKPTVTP